MQDFKKLAVWQRGHELTMDIFRVTRGFPAEERFGITSQLRRAAYSIPSNIAEGTGKSSPAELGRYCDISAGSANELEYFLILARDLGYLAADDFEQLNSSLSEVRRMLIGFIKHIRSS